MSLSFPRCRVCRCVCVCVAHIHAPYLIKPTMMMMQLTPRFSGELLLCHPQFLLFLFPLICPSEISFFPRSSPLLSSLLLSSPAPPLLLLLLLLIPDFLPLLRWQGDGLSPNKLVHLSIRASVEEVPAIMKLSGRLGAREWWREEGG